MPWNYCGLTEYYTYYTSDSASSFVSGAGSDTNAASYDYSVEITDGDGGGETQSAYMSGRTINGLYAGTSATLQINAETNYQLTYSATKEIGISATSYTENGYYTYSGSEAVFSTVGTDSDLSTYSRSTIITATGSTDTSGISEFVTSQVVSETFGDPVVEYSDRPVYYDSESYSATFYTSICSTRTITTSVESDASTEFFTSDQSYTVSRNRYDEDSTLSREVSSYGSSPSGEVTYDVLNAGVYMTGDCPTYRWDGKMPDKPFYVVGTLSKTITGEVQSSTFGYTTTEQTVTYYSEYVIDGNFPGYDLGYARSGGILITTTGTAESDTVTTTETADSSGYQIYITSSTKAIMLTANPKIISPPPDSGDGWGYESLQVTAISPTMPEGFIGFGNDESATSRGVYESITFDTSGQSFSNVPTAGVFSLLSFKDIGANASIIPTGPCALPENNSSRSLAWSTTDDSPEFATASNLLATHASTYESVSEGITETLTSTAGMAIGFSCSTSISDKDAFIDFVELSSVFTTLDDFGIAVASKVINSYVAYIAHNDDLSREKTLYFNPGEYTFTKYGVATSTVNTTILVPWDSYTMPDGEAWGINKVDIEYTVTSFAEYYRDWNYTFPPNSFLG